MASKPWQWPSERSCRFLKIVALGSQSDGKSSLFEALLGFRFNVREIEMAFPSEKDTNDSSSSNKVPLRVDTNSMKTKNKSSLLKEVLTNNCLVFDVNINDGSAHTFFWICQLSNGPDAYDAGSSGFRSLLSMGHSSGKKDRLYMKGPGGRGEAEVAISSVALSFLSLAATCSTASVTSLLVNVSSTYCPSKICSRYQLSAAMAFMLCDSQLPSSNPFFIHKKFSRQILTVP
ncbi:hypothetical protein GOBAR_DD01240 [Gossypium barbadense]|nr:hypothetical protein GOBAR_DD01240 [Gossypium barbadense]